MKNTLLTLSFILICFIAFSQNIITGRVVKVADGDTFTILDSKKKQHKIRFYGIDCPEKGQDFYQVAKDFIAKSSMGKEVRVEIKSKDRYGRNIGVVWVNNRNLNLQILRNGLAWHYKQYDKSKVYANAEADAKSNKINIWSKRSPIAPWDYRKNQKASRKA